MHRCLACGYDQLQEEPRTPQCGGSYEICPACGFQPGVTDEDEGISPEKWRQRWIASGAKWQSKGIPQPAGWSPR